MKKEEIEYLVIDLFAGAGGVTQGFVKVPGYKVIIAINHDPKAIKSHWLNHPDVHHFEEDIRTVSMLKLLEVVNKYRAMYPKSKLILWASLECTNFSKAKGGLPREADSRTLACDLYRYVDTLKPYLVMIENVVEFMSWGPLDKNGKPLSRKNGQDWLRWRSEMCRFGYVDDWRTMNSADFGSNTARTRLFGIFAPSQDDIHWPTPTHAKNPVKNGMFGELKKWRPVKECLDFSDEGVSIFNRKTPLVDKTLERIYAGLVKFVANGQEPEFLVKYNSYDSPDKNLKSLLETCPVITTSNRFAKVKAVSFIQRHNNGNPKGKVSSLENPGPTITTAANQSVVSAYQNKPINPCFLQLYYGNGYASDINNPCPTIRTKDGIGFVTSYYSGGGQLNSLDEPCPTITSKPKQGVCSIRFIDQQYGMSKPGNIDSPAGTITANPKLALCNAKPWIMDTSFSNIGQSINEPSATLLASRKHRYLLNPQYTNKGSSIENPCFTLIARMDKMPPYMVTAECGSYGIAVYEGDTEVMIKIKLFMAYHNLVDVKMRMLKVKELLKIQGFNENYKMAGNETDKKKFIGNSVVPKVVKSWATALKQVSNLKQAI